MQVKYTDKMKPGCRLHGKNITHRL